MTPEENRIIFDNQGIPTYTGDTFSIRAIRYSDPDRTNAARNAARYLGKTDIGNIKRPLSIVRMGHVPAIFRGEMVEFEFTDVSKEVYDHLVVYSTANMRVAGGNRALRSDGYVLASDKAKDLLNVEYKIHSSMQNYHDLLDSGETPQVARGAMPINAKMNIFVFQFNFVTLFESIFKQRLAEKGAQGNTVKVVQGMWELCKSIDPELWEMFELWHGKPAQDWVEVRRKIKKKKVTLGDLMICASGKDDLLEDVLIQLYGEQHSMW